MAKPYPSEIARLRETFDWSASAEIEPLRRVVEAAGYAPLRAIGSGGSLSAAHALAQMHQFFTRQMAAVATPLEAVEEPLAAHVGAWLLSAGGRNVDIINAASALIGREPRQLAVLCGRGESPLAELCARHAFVDFLLYPPPAGKDGFLATNSLLGFCALLARAYSTAFDSASAWADAHSALAPILDSASTMIAAWEGETQILWTRPTTLVLYGPSARVGAIDLESKFTEAALGNLQLADYRNFAHGRHHWLAKHGDTSAVLALITDADRKLAERTLAIIPDDIPQARLVLPGADIAAMLGSLIAGLRVAGWAGRARGIDPGNPGVPEFGRKLYHLPIRRGRRSPASREEAAIARKRGVAPDIVDQSDIERWRPALVQFRKRVAATTFAGVVLDYDGTIVDVRQRRFPASEEVASALRGLLEAGCVVGIATGRGASVRRDLQARLPRLCWDKVLIGYYNGAEIADLANEAAPDGADATCDALAPIAAALKERPELAVLAKQTNRCWQITLELSRPAPDNRLWDLAHEAVTLAAVPGVAMVRSGHSIDILAPGVSKVAVLEAVKARVGGASVLAIGDRGRWPGNDYEMLASEFALSVDEVSANPATCWNLASAGQRGPAALLEYLNALAPTEGGVRFHAVLSE